jgi:hypothetical protein
MVSIQFEGFTRGRAPLFPVGMMLTIVYISMAHESH